MPDATYKRNDWGPERPMNVTLSDSKGAIPLTSATAVHIYLYCEKTEDNTTRHVKTAPLTIVEAAAGKVKYIPEADDFAKAGEYKVEFEITWEDGSLTTVPNDGYKTLLVVPDLGPSGAEV